MSRITRIVPTVVLTVAALALVAPAAQAKPLITPSESTYVSPSVQSAQDFNVYGTQHRDAGAVVVTTGDKPLANPVQLPQNQTAGLTVSDSSGSGFDWTAAAIGAGLAGILMLMLAAGVGFRRRGQLAA